MANNASRSTIRSGTVQFRHRPSDKLYNMARIRAFVAEAANAAVQLLVFPEMCITGYWHVIKMGRNDIAALAELVPDGPSTRALAELAKQHGIVIGAGLIEAEGDRFYNSYVVVEPDGRHVVHRKASRIRESTHHAWKPVHRVRIVSRLSHWRSHLL